MKPPHPLVLMGLLSCLFGCGSDTPYTKKDGEWYYKKDRISTSKGETLVQLNKKFAKSDRTAYYESTMIDSDIDVATFEALTDHWAKDRNKVWYCDSYRDSKEYWSIKRYRTPALREADAKSFRMLDGYYARDTNWVYLDGRSFKVRDINTYVRLGDSHARDKVSGYFRTAEIKGSDGATFVEIDSKYSKDAKNVYYSVYTSDAGAHTPYERSVIITGADPVTFVALEDDYATDGRQAYHNGDVITKTVSNFRMLSRDYAIADGKVLYEGKVLPDADAETFKVLEVSIGVDATAEDKKGKFQYRERMKQ